MKKKVVSLVIVSLLLMVSLAGCSRDIDDYTQEEHLERVSSRVEKRYMKDDTYTGFQVFPLFNESDQLAYVLVEFEPQGFVYVQINTLYPIIHAFGGVSMYTRQASEMEPWQRYTIDPEKQQPRPDMDKKYEVDENGEYIFYKDSHFKVAQIENETRYLLRITQNGSSGLIPAVKRGDRYLNLVSMEEMEYEREIATKQYAIANVRFIAKSYFDL